MTASPISDLNPVFMAAGCKLMVMAKGTAPHPQPPPPDRGSKVVKVLDLIQNTENRENIQSQSMEIFYYTHFTCIPAGV